MLKLLAAAAVKLWLIRPVLAHNQPELCIGCLLPYAIDNQSQSAVAFLDEISAIQAEGTLLPRVK